MTERKLAPKARVLALEPHAVMRVNVTSSAYAYAIFHAVTGAMISRGWLSHARNAWEDAFEALDGCTPPTNDLAALGSEFLAPRDARSILDRLNASRRAGELFGLEPQRDGRLILSRYVLPRDEEP